MYPWFKFYFRRYLDYQSSGFYWNLHNVGFKVFFGDCKLFLLGIYAQIIGLTERKLMSFEDPLFFYWHENTSLTRHTQFNRHALRDKIISFFSIEEIF